MAHPRERGRLARPAAAAVAGTAKLPGRSPIPARRPARRGRVSYAVHASPAPAARAHARGRPPPAGPARGRTAREYRTG